MGSVRDVMNAAGTSFFSTEYAPYGEKFGITGTNPTNFEYTGEPFNANGLLDLRARHYDPSLGNFVSQDPLEFANRYGYVMGNPIKNIDPVGLVCLSWDCAADTIESATGVNVNEVVQTVEDFVQPPSFGGVNYDNRQALGDLLVPIAAGWNSIVDFDRESILAPALINANTVIGQVHENPEEALAIVLIVGGTAVLATALCGPTGGLGVVSNVTGNALNNRYSNIHSTEELLGKVALDSTIGGAGGCAFYMLDKTIPLTLLGRDTKYLLRSGGIPNFSSSTSIPRAAAVGFINATQNLVTGLIDEELWGESQSTDQRIRNFGFDVVFGAAMSGFFDWIAWKYVQNNLTLNPISSNAYSRVNKYHEILDLRMQSVLSSSEYQTLVTLGGTNVMGPQIKQLGTLVFWNELLNFNSTETSENQCQMPIEE